MDDIDWPYWIVFALFVITVIRNYQLAAYIKQQDRAIFGAVMAMSEVADGKARVFRNQQGDIEVERPRVEPR